MQSFKSSKIIILIKEKHSNYPSNYVKDLKFEVQQLTTRLWAFSVGIGPLLPLSSQLFTPDFMQQ